MKDVVDKVKVLFIMFIIAILILIFLNFKVINREQEEECLHPHNTNLVGACIMYCNSLNQGMLDLQGLPNCPINSAICRCINNEGNITTMPVSG